MSWVNWSADRDTGRISDGGAYGSEPWLDVEAGYGAYLVLEADADLGIRLADELYDLVEAAVTGSPAWPLVVWAQRTGSSSRPWPSLAAKSIAACRSRRIAAAAPTGSMASTIDSWHSMTSCSEALASSSRRTKGTIPEVLLHG